MVGAQCQHRAGPERVAVDGCDRGLRESEHSYVESVHAVEVRGEFVGVGADVVHVQSVREELACTGDDQRTGSGGSNLVEQAVDGVQPVHGEPVLGIGLAGLGLADAQVKGVHDVGGGHIRHAVTISP